MLVNGQLAVKFYHTEDCIVSVERVRSIIVGNILSDVSASSVISSVNKITIDAKPVISDEDKMITQMYVCVNIYGKFVYNGNEIDVENGDIKKVHNYIISNTTLDGVSVIGAPFARFKYCGIYDEEQEV